MHGLSVLLVTFLSWRALVAPASLHGVKDLGGALQSLSWPLAQRIRANLTEAAEGHTSGAEAWKLLELLNASTGAHAVVFARFGSEKAVLRFAFALQNAAFPRTVMRATSAADVLALRALATREGRAEFYALCAAGQAEAAWSAGAERIGATATYELWRLPEPAR